MVDKLYLPTSSTSWIFHTAEAFPYFSKKYKTQITEMFQEKWNAETAQLFGINLCCYFKIK